MKTIVLSDHTGDTIARGERRHSQSHDLRMAGYRMESEDLERHMEEVGCVDGDE